MPCTPILPATSKVLRGVVVPIPNLLVESFQNKLALSWAKVEPFENKIEPEVRDGKVSLLLNVVQSVEDRYPFAVEEA